MQAGVAIKKLALRLSPAEGSYYPTLISVRAGSTFVEGELKDLRTAHAPAPTSPPPSHHVMLTLLSDVKQVCFKICFKYVLNVIKSLT